MNNGIESVSFSGGNIDIIAQPGNSGEPALIQVQAFQSGTSIGNITVFSADAVDVSIVFSPSIRNVGSVRIHPAPGNVVRRLSLAGQIAGDMGEVEATGIANLGAVLSLEIQGDLTGHVTLFDNGLSDELRIRSLTVNGNIAPNLTIDAESGGIGTIEVGGVIGAPSNPVLIRSGRDITSITAGAMYANILAKWDDPNDPNAPTVYANIHELRTLFDTGGGAVHSGNFDGTILANSIGQPIERGFEIGTPGISQIEIQGDLDAGRAIGLGAASPEAVAFQPALPNLIALAERLGRRRDPGHGAQLRTGEGGETDGLETAGDGSAQHGRLHRCPGRVLRGGLAGRLCRSA